MNNLKNGKYIISPRSAFSCPSKPQIEFSYLLQLILKCQLYVFNNILQPFVIYEYTKNYSAEIQMAIKHVDIQHNDGNFQHNSIFPDLRYTNGSKCNIEI